MKSILPIPIFNYSKKIEQENEYFVYIPALFLS